MDMKPIIPLLPFSVCSGPEQRGGGVAVGPLALELEQRGVEDGEMLASVLEVDPDQLSGDLEVHHR